MCKVTQANFKHVDIRLSLKYLFKINFVKSALKVYFPCIYVRCDKYRKKILQEILLYYLRFKVRMAIKNKAKHVLLLISMSFCDVQAGYRKVKQFS